MTDNAFAVECNVVCNTVKLYVLIKVNGLWTLFPRRLAETCMKRIKLLNVYLLVV